MDERTLGVKTKETLYWSYNNFEELPDQLQDAMHIKVLYLKRNRLKTLPQWIGKLKNILILQIFGNYLESIPKELGMLTNLCRLDLGCNKLTAIPITIKNLNNLYELNLENNKLARLPDEIGSLMSLCILSVSCNKLTTLPNTIGCCINLQELNVENNKLVSIPSNLAFLKNLTTLRVDNNNLLYFPAIPFVNDLYIGCLNNNTLNYLSYDLRVAHILNLVTCEFNDKNTLTYSNVDIDNSNYNYLPNPMIEFTNNDKRRVIILPDTIQKIFQNKVDTNQIPSLREILLRAIYKNTPSNNKAVYYYKMNDSNLPKTIKDILIQGPTAKCTNCENCIFGECTMWVVPRLVNSWVSFQSEISTVMYFCSKQCVNEYKSYEVNEYLLPKPSTLITDWVRIK